MTRERTFICIKSESIQRHLIGEIIRRFEQRGLKLVGMKLVSATEEIVGQHYSDDEAYLISVGEKALKGAKSRGESPKETPLEKGRKVRTQLMEGWLGRPVIAMVWQGAHAVELGRKIVGDTSPMAAQSGTIRGDFTLDSYQLADENARIVRNLVHASGTPEEAVREIGIWFDEDEIVDYPLIAEEVLYGDNWGR